MTNWNIQDSVALYSALKQQGWGGDEEAFITLMGRKLDFVGFDPLEARRQMNARLTQQDINAYKMLAFYVGRRGTKVSKANKAADPVFAAQVTRLASSLPTEFGVTSVGRLGSVFPEYILAGRVGGSLNIDESPLSFLWIPEQDIPNRWEIAVKANLALTKRKDAETVIGLKQVILGSRDQWMALIDLDMVRAALNKANIQLVAGLPRAGGNNGAGGGAGGQGPQALAQGDWVPPPPPGILPAKVVPPAADPPRGPEPQTQAPQEPANKQPPAQPPAAQPPSKQAQVKDDGAPPVQPPAAQPPAKQAQGKDHGSPPAQDPRGFHLPITTDLTPEIAIRCFRANAFTPQAILGRDPSSKEVETFITTLRDGFVSDSLDYATVGSVLKANRWILNTEWVLLFLATDASKNKFTAAAASKEWAQEVIRAISAINKPKGAK